MLGIIKHYKEHKEKYLEWLSFAGGASIFIFLVIYGEELEKFLDYLTTKISFGTFLILVAIYASYNSKKEKNVN